MFMFSHVFWLETRLSLAELWYEGENDYLRQEM